MTDWNDMLDDGEHVSVVYEKRVGSVPQRVKQIDDFLLDLSDELLSDESKRGSLLGMMSPTHRRSASYNSRTKSSPFKNVNENGRLSYRARDLLPSELNSLIELDEPKFSLEIYEAILADDGENKIAKADRILSRILNERDDIKEQGKILRTAADINKRNFLFNESIKNYERAIKVEPNNAQNYLDNSKILEELGESEKAELVLKLGIENRASQEQLIPKLLKMYERRRKFNSVKLLVGEIYSQSGNMQAASSVYDGLLFEIRHGDVKKALQALSYLEKINQPKSSFYVDLSEDLRRQGYYDLSRYYANYGIESSPLLPGNWTQYIVIQDNSNDIIEALKQASQKLSISSIAKLTQTAAFQIAQYGDVKTARTIMSEIIAYAANDQRWRYIYNSAIIEIMFGIGGLSETLLRFAVNKTTVKSTPTVLLGLAKYFEEIYEVSKAKDVYKTLLGKYDSDWRIYLEYCLFLVRQDMRDMALKSVKKSLEKHPNTGRLWALYVQLELDERQPQRLHEAILSAPKSGEVWVEAARMAMNPLSPFFNLKNAEFYLSESFLFTPQYVDIFIEMIRLEILKNGLSANLSEIHDLFLSGEGNYGTVIYMFRRHGKEFTVQEFDTIVKGVKSDLIQHSKLYSHAIARSSFVVESIKAESSYLENAKKVLDPFLFSFGLSSFFDAVRAQNNNTDKMLKQTRKSLIFGSSMVLQ